MLPGQLSDRPGLRSWCQWGLLNYQKLVLRKAAEPNYAFAKGYGRFGMGYTRLATALGNFEQGNIQAEGTVVAQWLTSGLGLPCPAQGGICCLPAAR